MNGSIAQLRAALWWVVPLFVLAVVVGWETDWARAVDKRQLPAEPIAPKPVTASLLPEYAIAGGIAGRTDTVQRTLFNPTRRPAPVLAQDGSGGRLQRGQYALTGTTVAEGKSTAFLREIANNKARRVQAGDTINGVLVAEVKPDRVKLSVGDESEELVLRVSTNPRVTPAPVATQPAPGAPPHPGAQPAMPAAAAPGTQEAAQALERRRAAARAAAASAAQQPAPPGAAPPVAPPAMPPAPAQVPFDPAADQAAKARAAAILRGTPQ